MNSKLKAKTLWAAFLLLAALGAPLQLRAQEQQMSINVKDVSLRQVFNEIEHSTNYKFSYRDGLIGSERTVSISRDRASVKEILNAVLAKSGLTYEMVSDKSIVIIPRNQSKASDKKRQITGFVVDENGEPIIGATVRLQGNSSVATITDMDGKYTIGADNDDVLEISYVGYTEKNIKVGNKSVVDVTMTEDRQALDEVVVVGYGTQRKVSVTGSIATTKGDELAAVPTPNISNTLAGRLPGLISYNRSGEPGYDDAGILIRGASTIGDSSPLLVVDGVADRAGSLGRIDPNDIESISILKDASAAIYGSRAANGVILVTTKRGSQEGVKINYSGNFALSRPTILPEMCDSWQYAELINEINPNTYSNDVIAKFKDGSDPLNYPNIKSFDTLLRSGVQTQHSVSARGGSKTIQFYTSLGYQYQDNYYKNSASNYNQYNFRLNVDFEPSKYIKVGTNVSFRQEDRNSPVYGSEDIWRYLIKYNPMVNIWFPGTEYGNVSSKQDNFSPATGLDNTMGYQRSRNSYLSADLTLHLDLPFVVEGLSLDGGLYFDRANVFYKNFQNQYYLYSYDNGAYTPVQQGSNILSENMNVTTGITMNARLNYKHTFAKYHNVSAFVAWEQYKSRYDYLYGRRQDFVSTAIDQLFAGDSNTATNDGTASETARLNYFGRLDYDYAGKYLFQFNWRYDGSENFPSGKRFGFFPGVSVGWRISEESFWKNNVEWMDYLKLRASWGQMGNDKVAAFQYMTAYTFSWPGIFGANGGRINNGLRLNRTANPDITWEVANTFNVGLETRFLKFFNFEGDFFVTKRSNILTARNAAIPEYAGLTLPDENIGRCKSIGTELSLGYNRQVTNDWAVNASVNFSYAHGTIDYIDEPAETLEWQKRTGSTIGTQGNMFLMYQADGIFNTQAELDGYPHLQNARVGDVKFVDVDGDKDIDGNDKVRMDKPAVPEVMYGINLGARYKNLSLQMLWQGAARVWQYTFMEAGIIGNFTKDFYDNRWTEKNPNADYPRTYNRDATVTGGGDYRNSFWLNNASYLRLKSIELAYTCPARWFRNAPVTGVRFALSGYNLLTFTGIKNIDPETENNGQGWAAWNTPQSKVVNFGVNISF